MAAQVAQVPGAAPPATAGAFRRAFLRSGMGPVGAAMLALAVLLAIFAPLVAPYPPGPPARVSILDIYAPPDGLHWLGTDDAGRDVFTNLIYGARVSLIVGFFASFIAIAIGGAVGIIAGYFGGRIEAWLMRFTDVMLVIPDLPLAVVLVALTRPSLLNVILVIGILGWTGTARLVRAQTLAVKERKFVARARALGAGDAYIIARHVLPLVLPLMIANTVLVISAAILSESALSFLGLSDPSILSWGQMLNFAFTRGAVSAGAWWVLFAPGMGIVWVVLGCTLLGQGLERALNPRLEQHHLSRPSQRRKDDAGRVSRRLARFSRRQERSAGAASPSPSDRALLEELLTDRAPLLEVRDLTVDYRASGLPAARAVEGVSFTLRRGEMLGVVGESGCGKTTLMLALMRLLPPAGHVIDGQVLLDGRDILALDEAAMRALRWRRVAMVFQGAMNALNPVRTVGDQIAEAILRHGIERDGRRALARAGELLGLVGIAPERRDHYPHQYSGGMRQRALIAMALACNPQVIIADEPTTALDVMVQAQILELLDRLRHELGLAVVLVTHDLGVVAEVCDRVLVMYGGVAAEYADVDTIFNAPRHPYTQQLLRAFPDLARPGDRLLSIPGAPPRLDALPPGCRFAPRCPLAFERCRNEAPALVRAGHEHVASCHLVDGGRS